MVEDGIVFYGMNMEEDFRTRIEGDIVSVTVEDVLFYYNRGAGAYE